MRIIDPGDQAEQVARDLLSLAKSPHDVQTNSDEGLRFIVPDWLADAYADIMTAVLPAAETTTAPKRRARARKEL